MEATYTEVTRSCGHTSNVLLAVDAVRAAEVIVELKTSTCPPCTRVVRASVRRITWRDGR